MGKIHRWLLISLVGIAIASCGGDSDPGNTAPTLSLASSFSVQEGSVTVGTASGTDAENNSLTFSLFGTDAALFSISSSGAISFRSAPDYESPADNDSDNAYEISVSVSDGRLSSLSESTTITVTDAFEGRVVDGPMSGASVFIDLDGDGVPDADEPSGATDSNGFFIVDTFTAVSGVQPRIISVGGTDTATGNALPKLALIADVPSDQTVKAVVTPLSTVLSSADSEEEKTAVLQGLGITGSAESVVTTDNWALAESGDETAKSVQAVNQQVALVLQTAATLVESDTSTTEVSAADLAVAVADKVVSLATTSSSVDLSSADTVSSILTDAVQASDGEVTVSTEAIAAVATSVAEVNDLVGSADLDPTSAEAAAIAETAQSTLQSSAADVAAGTTEVSDFMSSNTTAKLFLGSTALASAPDFDADGIADIADLDDDNDGVNDSVDAFPKNADETLDTDSDGIGNNADTDDDGDGVEDSSDVFPLDASETLDTDGDGIGNNTDEDDDGDRVPDGSDAFPLIPLDGRTDSDGDGRPNTCNDDCLATGMIVDDDDDGDGVLDIYDIYPLVALGGLIDTDGDGVPNDCDADCTQKGMTADSDDDADGISDTDDIDPTDPLKPPGLNWDNGNWDETKWN